MNIKRAFLAAVATLMVPGFAMAQTTITFDTVLDLLPDGPYDQTVTATLTCNTGNPLQQSFEIGPTTEDKVVFVVENFDLAEFISCEITASTLSGFFVVSVGANTDSDLADADSCVYVQSGEEVAEESVVLNTDTPNTCVFTMAPAPFEFEIEKVWNFDSDVDVSEIVTGDWECTNVVVPSRNDAVTTVSGGWGLTGDGTYTVDEVYIDGSYQTLHPNPWAGDLGGTTTCTAQEFVVDSAVESDQGCAGGTSFTVGTTSGSCTITNTVFFEGIPTLSQYGMAIMALLMLGVGFIGFRRFV